ncbi:phage tail protein [Glaciecola sp. MF2-115]|uniref:phage tail protein n=1 Tax=Glaciecola sp. MF2-115 TaxID=3384827 RepID=UPI0039A2C512|mmetsp:Transcript_71679/g.226469  ORF Transcript_71679/g.226469 Transcript_71679/m.226469 type:complete len:195 (-) Transcript_71679:1966-2550(-)
MKKLFCILFSCIAGLATPNLAFADEPYLGEMIYFAGNFAPRGYAFCDGQLLSIAENSALFSLLGTTYGGDGRTTFALPDMRGRALMHAGNGPGLTPRSQGLKTGVEENTLTIATMQAHTHSLKVAAGAADSDNPSDAAIAEARMFKAGTSPTVTMDSSSITETGNTPPEPINNIQPTITLNCIIATSGLYPSRS